jgi:CHAT domain-containing protein
VFEGAHRAFVRGDLVRAQVDAKEGRQYYSGRNPAWAWNFRILEARVLAWRGMYDDVLDVLNSELPSSLKDTDVLLQKEILEGAANVHLHRYPQAQAKLAYARQKCAGSSNPICGELLNVEGLLQVEQGEYRRARPFYEGSLQLARRQGDHFSEASALLKLSQVELLEQHFDEAIDRSDEAYRVARLVDAQIIMTGAQGNMGWALYKTGDSDKALSLFRDAGKSAHELGARADEVRWLTTSGYVYVDQGKFDVAQDLYRKGLDLATQIDSKEDILNAQISLAFVSVLTGKLDLARRYSEQAIASASADGNRIDELYPLLTKGQVAARQGDPQQAEQILSEVASDPKVNPSLKWEAQHELANLYADQRQAAKAEAAYRTTLATFEAARSSIQHEAVKLPFLANASSLYNDYVHFLLSQERTAEALSVADHGRARTLAEGVGQLRKSDSVLPIALDAQGIARRAGGPVLYYFLGEKQSYLWVITAQKTSLFQLPPASEIDVTVRRYRKALESPRDIGASENPDALGLYRVLVQPAQSLLTKSSKVFIIPDGSLNALNFEALLVPDAKPHYWIEDVTIANASSLRLLEHSRPNNHAGTRRLLLVGNPVAASPEYGTLPQAALEMSNIGRRFPVADQQVLAAAEATPAGYLAGKPEQFTYIHFVAHGTASRLSPLDSAIVLSKAGPADDTFRLYARDIIHSPLHADLVTISACYGAGTRAYSGEGLVGLSWAFLRAGAHNVIGALWDVSDASTPQLMDRMYAEIQDGKRPEDALRAAKLSLLHSDKAFHRPFYWAPFQFYTGS